MTNNNYQKGINLKTAQGPVLNDSGVTLLEGHIVAQSPTTDDAVTLTTIAGQLDVIGVIGVGGEDGEDVYFSSSCPFNVLVTGAVTRGDFIETSAVAGVAQIGVTVPGAFGIAVESNPDVGVKLVRCRGVLAELF